MANRRTPQCSLRAHSLVLTAAVLITLPFSCPAAAAAPRWEVTYPRPDRMLNGVAVCGELFVAVGDRGAVEWSADGEQWHAGRVESEPDLQAVACHGGTTVAVGSFGNVATSTGGGQWVVQQLRRSWHFTSVTYGNGRFTAVGRWGVTATSEDGLRWELRHSGRPDHILWIGWDKERFVEVLGDGSVLASRDGESWEGVPATILGGPGRNARPETWNVLDHRCSLVSRSGQELGCIDPRVWFGVRDVAVRSSRAVAVRHGGILLRDQGGGDWRGELAMRSGLLFGVAHTASGWVAVGERNLVVTSDDGRVWAKVATPEPAPDPGYVPQLRGVACHDRRCVAVGRSGGLLTEDCRSWRNIPHHAVGILWAGRFISWDGTRAIDLSDDGLEWRRVELPIAGVQLIVDGGSRLVAFSATGETALSRDGRVWEPGPAEDLRGRPLQWVVWTGEAFVALIGGSLIGRSTDLSSWHYYGAGMTASDLLWTGKELLLLGDRCASSSDGASWQPEELPARFHADTGAAHSGEAVAIGYMMGQRVGDMAGQQAFFWRPR